MIGENTDIPAHNALFAPLPIVVTSQWMTNDMPPIDPEEAEQVSNAVLQRRIEFATGRSCAHRAFAQLGIGRFVFRNDRHRAPRWPTGLVGSITHTGAIPGGYCGVAVGRAADVRTIGFDAETRASHPLGGDLLPEESWPTILTPAESVRLRRVEPVERTDWVRLVFSAKECFYKAQYPLSRTFLDFQEVETVIDASASTFEAYLLGSRTGHPLGYCQGRYLRTRDFTLTGIALPA
jgi:4'-phosphopantetheinyl transferase EntD